MYRGGLCSGPGRRTSTKPSDMVRRTGSAFCSAQIVCCSLASRLPLLAPLDCSASHTQPSALLQLLRCRCACCQGASAVACAGVRWIRNAQGQPVIDRAYNMVQLLNMYMGRSPIADEDVSWDVANPNQLSVRLRGADQSLLMGLCMKPEPAKGMWAMSWAGTVSAGQWATWQCAWGLGADQREFVAQCMQGAQELTRG
jgi:hypothetical protein